MQQKDKHRFRRKKYEPVELEKSSNCYKRPYQKANINAQHIHVHGQQMEGGEGEERSNYLQPNWFNTK